MEKKRLHLLSLFTLAYLISWLLWLSLVTVGQGWATGTAWPYLHALGFSGPALAAIIVTAVQVGSMGVKHLLAGVFKFRFDFRYYLFVLIIPPLFFTIAAGIAVLLGEPWPDLKLYGRLDDLFPGFGLLPTILAHFLIIGLGEEIGWRGYALPRLQDQRPAWQASIILGVIWGLWHLPTFIFSGGILEGLGTTFGFVIVTIPVAVIYTWLYNSTGGSILIVALWSTATTLAIASQAASPVISGVMGAMFVILALVLVRLGGPERLSGWTRSSSV